jgi:hypothetical protein
MKSLRPFLSSLALAGLLSACVTPQPPVQTQAKPGATFNTYRTYTLMPLPAAGPASDPGLMLRIGEPAREAVVQGMAAKGLTQADPAQADLAIHLRGSRIPKIEITDWGFTRTAYTASGRIPVHVGPTDVRKYEERTLIVEVFDNRSKDLVWAGWNVREATGKVMPEHVQGAIRSILAVFPGGVSAQPVTK